MRLLTIALLGFLGTTALAKHKDAVFTGDGCPKDSSDVVINGETVSVLFSEFVAEAGDGAGKPAVRTTCNFSVPLEVPPGMSIAVYKIDYRGYQSLPKHAKGTLEIEYDVGKHKTPKYQKQFSGEKMGEYVASDTLGAGAMKFAGCEGGVVNLAVRAAVTAESKDGRPAIFALDTIDGAPTGGLKYRMKFKPCKEK